MPKLFTDIDAFFEKVYAFLRIFQKTKNLQAVSSEESRAVYAGIFLSNFGSIRMPAFLNAQLSARQKVLDHVV